MSRAKLIKLLFLFLVFFTAFLLLSGYMAQFLYNYDFWKASGAVLGDGSAPIIPSFSFLDCLKAIFRMPTGLYGLLFCGALIGVPILIVRFGYSNSEEYDAERNLTYSSEGTYGTAGYMNKKEMDKVLKCEEVKNTRGIILGRLDKRAICLPADTRMNRNIAVYGASGSMKSRAFARNMLLQCVRRRESVIVTDPKSELYNDMAVYLKENGYEVKVFNLVNLESSDSWNCLREIKGQELMAQLLTDVIIKNTGSEKSDHFWDNAESNLLKALALYVDLEYPEDKKSMDEVYKLITLNNEAALNKIFDFLPMGHPAKAPYSIFKQASDNVRSGVIIGLGSRLQVFQNKLICSITNYKEIDLTLPGQSKCAYFCITSDQDSTFDFLSSLFFSFLFISLVRYADKTGKDGKLDIPVTFVLEEFPNIGKIPDFTKKISTIRSRNISVSIIFQNLAQLENRYPLNQWQEILGNCDTQLFLGCTDAVTAKYISDRTGEVSIAVSSRSKELNSWRFSDYTPQYKETSSTGRRKLLTADEVLRMPLDDMLIILRGQKVLRAKKFDYSLHPESKKLIRCNAVDHLPAWRDNHRNMELSQPSVIDKCSTTEDHPIERQEEKRNQPHTNEIAKKTLQKAESFEQQKETKENTPQKKVVTHADKDSIMS